MGAPQLEERFLEPPGWRWHQFKREGRTIRYGTVAPKDTISDAVVVCLEGLGEFGEKYFELARDCLARNMTFWVFDLMGQGKSGRFLKNPHKRHSSGFEDDVDDLHALIMGYVKHSSVSPDRGRIPLVMLAHSTGGNIGFRYLLKHPGIFECAAFSAPLLNIKAVEHWSPPLASAAGNILGFLLGQAGPGATQWSEQQRTAARESYSGDAKRRAVHNAWCLADPALQVGSVTFGWLNKAIQSCAVLRAPGVMESIQTHCLLALAGQDMFVGNAAIRSAAARLPHAELVEFPDSYHEILMERDSIRNVFLEKFYGLVKDRIINRPETLKPF